MDNLKLVGMFQPPRSQFMHAKLLLSQLGYPKMPS